MGCFMTFVNEVLDYESLSSIYMLKCGSEVLFGMWQTIAQILEISSFFLGPWDIQVAVKLNSMTVILEDGTLGYWQGSPKDEGLKVQVVPPFPDLKFKQHQYSWMKWSEVVPRDDQQEVHMLWSTLLLDENHVWVASETNLATQDFDECLAGLVCDR